VDISVAYVLPTQHDK